MTDKIQDTIRFYKQYGGRNFIRHYSSQLRFETKLGRALNKVYIRIRYTDEELLEDARQLYSDAHKTVYGHRWVPMDATADELYDQMNNLYQRVPEVKEVLDSYLDETAQGITVNGESMTYKELEEIHVMKGDRNV